MAESEKKRNNVYLDVKAAMLKLQRKKNYKIKQSEVAKDHYLTSNTLNNWDKIAPPAVKFLYHFMKENDFTFEELVKEIES